MSAASKFVSPRSSAYLVSLQAAFEKLDTIYGTYTEPGLKSGYTLPRQQMTNADLARIINSAEVQAVLNAAKPEAQKRTFPRKKNALKNLGQCIWHVL